MHIEYRTYQKYQSGPSSESFFDLGIAQKDLERYREKCINP